MTTSLDTPNPYASPDAEQAPALAPENPGRQGFFYGVGAYGLWGLVALYFKSVGHVPPLGVLAHRVFWSFLLLALLVAALGKLPEFFRALSNPRTLLLLAGSTTFIAVNWFTYIHAVSTERVLQASLGYYMTPLANVALGILVLGERLRGWQLASLALAALGVIIMGTMGSEFPWISVSLAVSFSLYGLLRKTMPVDSLLGLFAETCGLLPIAVGFLLFAPAAMSGGVPAATTLGLLALSGPVTTAPLLLFAAAARRLRMSTLGFLQFLAPSLQFLLAVLVFGEEFKTAQIVSFACIWSAVAVYAADAILSERRERALRAAAEELAASVGPK
jgi:chloramphenicol-sensitive protein RarD